jgi:hypothetical protein
MNAIELLLSDRHGIYIPQLFVNGWLADDDGDGEVRGVSDWAREQCAAGPDSEHYWEAWDDILRRFEFRHRGDSFTLNQDGDLWLMCYERMTDEEKHNFGFED